ncbi:peptidoglycan-binding domain-containing protein [Frigidibacter sp. ROC022]|uniref:peptidoglycan-binding domain-containing protein n=1 Tax=Frigidibacter sp. ROC022 TaxID=2971796 RepID=UPI00215AAAD9|nr:peptidoglycan-binding domain-containing protein [Frigidibacter sp. ROC022]MCR8725317.1 peptidoglycan-binding protein [Frigidibacter sp. ROC022]
MTRSLLTLTAALALAGCAAPDGAPPAVARQAEAPLVLAEDSAPPPPGAAPGSCYAQDRTPTEFETVKGHVLVNPEVRDADGTVISPAIYREATYQKISGGGAEILIETPCRDQITPEFVASLQRALAVRSFYAGPITGKMDPDTRLALRSYQRQQQGLDSAILSIEAARSLGLVAYARVPD